MDDFASAGYPETWGRGSDVSRLFEGVEGRELVASSLVYGLQILAKAGMQKKKPYLLFLVAKMKRGERHYFFDSIWPFLNDFPVAFHTNSSYRACVWAGADMFTVFYPMKAESQVERHVSDFFQSHIVQFSGVGQIPEICDHCRSEPPSGTKLRRCVSCKVARYCSESCQRSAWKSGHKKACKSVAEPAQ